jgi:3-(3-hydroxy-phenyl)propionate hydroxylase
VQDADNLAWKLDLVLRGVVPEALLDSYHQERAQAADENLRHTTRSTDFIAPKSGISRVFRDSALALAETEPFARRLINSGRLSTATCYERSALNGPDGFTPGEALATRPGAAALDAPLEDEGWFLDRIGDGFAGVWFSRDGMVPPELSQACAALASRGLPVNQPVVVSRETVCARYGAEAQPAFYLFRPDQHVAARWREFSTAELEKAIARAVASP